PMIEELLQNNRSGHHVDLLASLPAVEVAPFTKGPVGDPGGEALIVHLDRNVDHGSQFITFGQNITGCGPELTSDVDGQTEQKQLSLPLPQQIADLTMKTGPVAVAFEGGYRRGHTPGVIGHGDPDPSFTQVER